MNEKKKSAAERMFDIFGLAICEATYWCIDTMYDSDPVKRLEATQLIFALRKIGEKLKAVRAIAVDIGNGQRAYLYDSDFWDEDQEKLLKNPPLQMMYDYLYVFVYDIEFENTNLAMEASDPARRFEASFMASAAHFVSENVKCKKRKVRRIIGGSRKGGAE